MRSEHPAISRLRPSVAISSSRSSTALNGTAPARRAGYLHASRWRKGPQDTHCPAACRCCCVVGSLRTPRSPGRVTRQAKFCSGVFVARRAEQLDERTDEMHHIGPAELHYIAADLDSREWVEAGFARLDDYLARWSLFGQL